MASSASTQRRKSPPDPTPRKRRKRTVVTGAPDDCFTCARQAVQCDRRRPFCSQCLDHGLECSGYKTPLTWGVGVASRGKLRGLSVPITGSQPTSAAPKPPRPKRVRNGQSQAVSPRRSPSSTNTGGDLTTFSVSGLNSPAQQFQSAPDPALSFDSHSPFEFSSSQLPVKPPRQNHVTLHLSATQRVHEEITRRRSSAAVQTFAGLSHEPWSELPHAQESDTSRRHDDNCGDIALMTGLPEPSFSRILLSRSVGDTPRLRYLISYYAEVIAPMVVAFDSPTNPFRTHILRLAQDSIALQEAIATLSASNIRSRQERRMNSTERTLPARMSSWAHRALTDGECTSGAEDLIREEQRHRGRAVSALNLQLADHNERLSDSVLATLLILCLFHGCDTGIAHFKTQFAGVIRLLALRMHNSSQISDDLEWFIRVFTWYDSMTATTNDREMQLRGTCLRIASASDGEWGLENLTGCDAGLFKYVAQLGRLNVLSQRKEAITPALPEMFLPFATVPPAIAYSFPSSTVPHTSMAADTSSLPQPSSSRLGPGDGETCLSPEFWAEWHALRQKLESWRYQPRSMSTLGYHYAAASTTEPSYIPTSHSVVLPQNLEDVSNISECFRHAALLYTERLAYPHLETAHPRFQDLVHRTMHYISAVKSDVYLLWPLFIAGSESVLEAQHATIRQRCRDISQDSGFVNNLSCLEVLEKIWAAGEDRSFPGIATGDHFTPMDSISPSALGNGFAAFPPRPSVSRNQGLRWCEVMKDKQSEGEYMVV